MENKASLQENSVQLSTKRGMILLVSGCSLRPRVELSIYNFDVALLGLKRKAEEENIEPDSVNKIQKIRTRVRYSKEQLVHLEAKFDENNYPDIFEKEKLAVELNVKEKNVHVSLDYIYIYN